MSPEQRQVPGFFRRLPLEAQKFLFPDRFSPLEKAYFYREHDNPEQAALKKIEELARVLKGRAPKTIEVPRAKAYFYCEGNHVGFSLYEKVGATTQLGFDAKTFHRTLGCLLVTGDLSSSTLSTSVRDFSDLRAFPAVVYRHHKNKSSNGYSFIFRDYTMTPQGQEFIACLPTFDQMPTKIDLPKAVVAICDVVLELARDEQLTPDRIAKLREVVYGQAAQKD